jgi:hypothetical protein
MKVSARGQQRGRRRSFESPRRIVREGAPTLSCLRNLACAVLLVAPCMACAFTFSDGTTASCVVDGSVVPEVDVPQSAEVAAPTGETVRTATGYRINWNPYKLKSLPPEMRDFLFFHECAHARLPTRDEVAANCAGLQDMRAAGRAGVGVEARMAAFYGPGSKYWSDTLRCANPQSDAPK